MGSLAILLLELENSGPNQVCDLFKDRWTILTPEENRKDSELKKFLVLGINGQ